MSKDNTSIAGEIASNVAIFGGTLLVLNLAPKAWRGLKHRAWTVVQKGEPTRAFSFFSNRKGDS